MMTSIIRSCIVPADINKDLWATINSDKYYIKDNNQEIWEFFSRVLINGESSPTTIILQKEGDFREVCVYVDDIGNGLPGIVNENGIPINELNHTKIMCEVKSFEVDTEPELVISEEEKIKIEKEISALW